jgi:hypothetical protein
MRNQDDLMYSFIKKISKYTSYTHDTEYTLHTDKKIVCFNMNDEHFKKCKNIDFQDLR